MDLCLSDDLYILFRDLLLTRYGLFFPERKRADLQHGLSMAARVTGHTTLDALYRDASADRALWTTIIDHLTIGETYFFRNTAQFDALRQQIIPELLARRAAIRTLRFWSAGCATGEEPYSLVMTLCEMLADIDQWQTSILATDINQTFLGRAREALYGSWSFRETSDTQRERFFIPEQGRWRVRPDIRRRVSFAYLNLADAVYPSIINGTCALDLLLCRNVTIYFDEATTRQVIERFYAALSPGGWLIVGHAEPQASIFSQFEVHNFPGTVIYRKPLDAPLFAFDPARGTFSAGASPILMPRLAPLQDPSAGIKQDFLSKEPPFASSASLRAGVAQARPPQPSPYPAGTSAGYAQSSEEAARPEQPALIAAGAPWKDTAATAMGQSAPTAGAAAGPAGDRWAAIKARLAQGDKAGAELLLQELLRQQPGHVPALTAMGRLCADRGDWASARRHCEQAITHEPLSAETHYILAQVQEHQGELEEALASYRRAVYLDRGFIAGMVGMANIWRQTGHFTDARRGFRNALRQLAALGPSAPIPGADGLTAGELAAYAASQLAALERM